MLLEVCLQGKVLEVGFAESQGKRISSSFNVCVICQDFHGSEMGKGCKKQEREGAEAGRGRR